MSEKEKSEIRDLIARLPIAVRSVNDILRQLAEHGIEIDVKALKCDSTKIEQELSDDDVVVNLPRKKKGKIYPVITAIVKE